MIKFLRYRIAIMFYLLINYELSVEKTINAIKEKISNINFNKYIHNLGPNIPHQTIEIIEFNDEYVVVKSSKYLSIQHGLYKAIEFFNSKYKKFNLKIYYKIVYNEDYNIVKFIAYNIEK